MKTKNQFPLCNHLKYENKKHAINSLFHTIAEQSGKQFAQYVYSFELCTLHGQKIILLLLIAITSNLHCQKFTLYTLLQQPCLYSLRFYTIASLSACAIITVQCTLYNVYILYCCCLLPLWVKWRCCCCFLSWLADPQPVPSATHCDQKAKTTSQADACSQGMNRLYYTEPRTTSILSWRAIKYPINAGVDEYVR